MISFKRYSIALLVISMVSPLSILALVLYFDPIVGDLTRIGWFSENEFGYSSKQRWFAAQGRNLYTQYTPHDAVIFGDSFSREFNANWTQYFEELTGITSGIYFNEPQSVQTVLDDSQYAASPPKLVVFQIVERNLKQFLGHECERSQLKISPQPDFAALILEPKELQSSLRERATSKRWSDDHVVYVRDYLYNRARIYLDYFRVPVVVAKLRQARFSNKIPDMLLTYSQDLMKQDWTQEDMRNIACNLEAMQNRVQSDGRTVFIAMVIPDKLTAYRSDILEAHYNVDPVDFNHKKYRRMEEFRIATGDRINQARVGPVLRNAIKKGEKDVYLPNDTHLSSRGSQLIAQELARYIKSRGARG